MDQTNQNRLIKKEKNQTIWSTKFKGVTRRKPIGFVIMSRLILTKHKTTICYSHNTLLSSVDATVSEFFKSKDIRKRSLHFQDQVICFLS